MLGRKCIPIPCTVYLFSGAAGLLGGRGGGGLREMEGEPHGAVKLQGEWVAQLQCILYFYLFILLFFFLVHTFTALLLICALMRQNCQLHRLTGG